MNREFALACLALVFLFTSAFPSAHAVAGFGLLMASLWIFIIRLIEIVDHFRNKWISP